MNDRDWMQYAIEEAKCAFKENEVPVGAVVVKENRIISKAHNTCNYENDPLAHAEMLALKDAYAKLDTLKDCTLYVTLEPCAMCAGAMIHLRLPRLVFGAFDPVCGCCGSRIDLTDHWFDHETEAIGGISEEECASLLKSFFHKLRNE